MYVCLVRFAFRYARDISITRVSSYSSSGRTEEEEEEEEIKSNTNKKKGPPRTVNLRYFCCTG